MILIFLLFSSILALPQSTTFSRFVNFENENNSYVEIETTQEPNIWQIGIPNKIHLDSAYSNPNAIVTFLLDNYPTNNYSSFQIKFLPPENTCWGSGEINFYHKYDFEQNKDGGFIELRYDSDSIWTNIIQDTDAAFGTNSYNFYTESDTILGNIPAFTGSSNEWVHSQFQWTWQIGVKSVSTEFHDSLTLRFSVKTDDEETNQEGWIIDNVDMKLFDCTTNINQLKKERPFVINPNPTKGKISIKGSSIEQIDVYNSLGVLIQSTHNKEIDLSQETKGVYFINMISKKGAFTEKVLVK